MIDCSIIQCLHLVDLYHSLLFHLIVLSFDILVSASKSGRKARRLQGLEILLCELQEPPPSWECMFAGIQPANVKAGLQPADLEGSFNVK